MAKEIKSISALKELLASVDVGHLDFGKVEPIKRADGSYEFELEQTGNLKDIQNIARKLNNRFSVVRKNEWTKNVGSLLADDDEERQDFAKKLYEKSMLFMMKIILN